MFTRLYVGRNRVVGVATRYGSDGPGIESRKFSAAVQIGPGAHPASCTMGTGSFLGVKRPGRGADLPHLSKYRGNERVGLYLYLSSWPQWHVIGRNFTPPPYLHKKNKRSVWPCGYVANEMCTLWKRSCYIAIEHTDRLVCRWIALFWQNNYLIPTSNTSDMSCTYVFILKILKKQKIRRILLLQTPPRQIFGFVQQSNAVWILVFNDGWKCRSCYVPRTRVV